MELVNWHETSIVPQPPSDKLKVGRFGSRLANIRTARNKNRAIPSFRFLVLRSANQKDKPVVVRSSPIDTSEGEKAALAGTARRGGELATTACFSPRSFACGCAALRNFDCLADTEAVWVDAWICLHQITNFYTMCSRYAA